MSKGFKHRKAEKQHCEKLGCNAAHQSGVNYVCGVFFHILFHIWRILTTDCTHTIRCEFRCTSCPPRLRKQPPTRKESEYPRPSTPWLRSRQCRWLEQRNFFRQQREWYRRYKYLTNCFSWVPSTSISWPLWEQHVRIFWATVKAVFSGDFVFSLFFFLILVSVFDHTISIFVCLAIVYREDRSTYALYYGR